MPELRAKFVICFNPFLNNQRLLIYKKQTNEVCIKLNCASNNVRIVLHFNKSLEMYLMKS